MTRIRFAVVLICCALATSALADQKVKTRMTMQGNSFESTSYVKGQRMRDEQQFGPMTMVTIHQCDLNQTIQVNDRTKTYMITKEEAASAAPAAARSGQRPSQPPKEAEAPSGPTRSGGTITISTSLQDMGETKDFFGYKARHLKTSMSYESSPDACNPGSGKVETDGWYINFEPGVHVCARPDRQMFSGGGGGRSRPSCQDKMKYSGPGMAALFQRGYPVDETMTMTDKEGKQFSVRKQALDVSRATLDPALFDAPAGYQQVSSYSEMMGMGNMAAMMGSAARSGSSRNASNYNVARAPAPTPEVGAKQPGKLRVGVAALQDKSGKTKLDGDALRNELIAKLQRFGYDVVPADGADDEQVTADARKKDCDYLLFTDVTARDAPSAKKIGGFLGRRITGIGGNDSVTSFEGSVGYRLFKMGDPQPDKPELEAKQDAKGSTVDEAITPTFEHESREVAQQIAKDKRGG